MEYSELQALLDPGFRVIPIDLAGFGAAAAVTGYSVTDMAQAVAAVIRATAAPRWSLVGHSMGAKVATVLTSFVETGSLSLKGEESVILIAGSPPSPEPMGEEKRDTMMNWFKGDAGSRAEARLYLEQNVTAPLVPAAEERAIDDLLRMNRSAWTAWLRSGSREDWSERVGSLQTPALLLAGADDESLGADAQRRYMAPHFSRNRLHVIDGTTHLLPLEAPAEVARLIAHHSERLVG